MPCLKEIKRVTKKGGTALITAAPTFQSTLYPIVNKIVMMKKKSNLTQLKQYFHTAGELREASQKAGFTDIEIHGVYGGNSIWLDRLLPVVVPPFLKVWDHVDNLTADAPILKNFSNMFLIVAKY